MKTSNYLLKSMVSKVNKYRKSSFINKLGVDIQNCEPMLNPSYDSKTMKDNLFIFLDDNNRILGFLTGSTMEKDLNDNYSKYTDFSKNRKNLSLNCKNILMITPDMRTRKYQKPGVRRSNNTDHKKELMNRLQEYKHKKYSQYSHDDILKIVQDTLIKLSSNLYNDQIIKALKPVNNYWDNNVLGLIKSFTNVVQGYNRYYKDYQECKEYDPSSVFESYFYKDYIEHRNAIIKWSQLLKQF